MFEMSSKKKKRKKTAQSFVDNSENKQNTEHIKPPPVLTLKEKFEYGDAVRYFQHKLQKDPKMSRYNHCMGALYTEAGDFHSADAYYKNALTSAASNVMIRNDYALHLSRNGYTKDGVEELKKGMLSNPNQPTLRKNLGAVLARHGKHQI